MIKKAIFVRIKKYYLAMQQREGFKRFLPDLAVVAILIIIACAFCYPAFQGNILDQSDSRTWLESSAEARDYYNKTQDNPFWTNNMFSGMPQNMSFFFSKNDWSRKIDPPTVFGGKDLMPTNPALYFILALLSFFILTRVLHVNRWLGLAGAVAFAFSSYNPQIIAVGHMTKMLDIAYLPGILAGVIVAYRGKYLQGGALTAIFLAFFLNAGHWQIIYYGALTVGILGLAQLVQAIREKKIARWAIASAVLAATAVVVFLTSYTRIAMAREYEPYSTRGGKSELTGNIAAANEKKTKGLDRDYAFSWSLGKGEVFCLMVPNLFGGAMSEDIGAESHLGEKLSSMGVPEQQIEQITAQAPLYWGAQQEMLNLAGPVYFGAVICLLFVLSLLVIRSNYKWWIAGTCLFFILLAMGKNLAVLNDFMFYHFPAYSKFRVPSMTLAIPSVLFPLLAVWALKDIYKERITREELWKKLRIAIGITGGLCLVLLLASKTTFDYKGDADQQLEQRYGQYGPELMKALREDRADAASGDALRSLIFILLAGGALWGYAKGKMSKEMALGAVALLIAIDEVPVAARYLNKDNYIDATAYEDSFQPSQTDRQIMADKETYFRVFDLSQNPFNSPRASLFHKSVGGYSGAKMQIYQELIEQQLGKLNYPVLNMLNTKYFIVPSENQQTTRVQQNPGALGNAWFVGAVQWVNTADEEINALSGPSLNNPNDSAAGNFSPATTAVIRNNFKNELNGYDFGKDSAAYVRLTPDGYGVKHLKFESSNSKNGLAVFSDIYYPIGWKATIDGREVPIMRANYVLRALKIPAGKHTIEFSFDSPAFRKGEKIALIGSILLTLLVAAGIFAALREKRQPAHEAAPAAGSGPGNPGKA